MVPRLSKARKGMANVRKAVAACAQNGSGSLRPMGPGEGVLCGAVGRNLDDVGRDSG